MQTKIWSLLIHNYSNYSKNGFFGPQNIIVQLEHGKKNFFLTLNVKILQMVWNECVRFDRHIEVQVSYKIIWLEVP
jgi:hypothetical protein